MPACKENHKTQWLRCKRITKTFKFVVTRTSKTEFKNILFYGIAKESWIPGRLDGLSTRMNEFFLAKQKAMSFHI